jgi:hypothetical protein
VGRYNYDVRPVNVFADFMAGKNAAQEERAAGRRNALADMQLQRAESVNALSQNPNATPEDYIRAGDTQTGTALQSSRTATDEGKQRALLQFAQLARRGLEITDPQARRAFLKQATAAFGPHLSALGGDPAKSAAELDSLSDEELTQRMTQVAQFAPAQPAAAPIKVSPGETLLDPATRKPIYSAPHKPEKATAQWRYLTPDEIKQRGLPEGTSAQIDESSGKIDVVNKREGLSGAEQKTIREAKMRMPRLNATLRRVDRLGQAVDGLSKNVIFDGGPMDAMALRYSKQGQEINAAAAQLMPELQALTRVPGIGSQSDLEARLASLALPSLEMSPEVNKRSHAELRAFVEDLKSAYASLLEGSGSPEQEKPAAAQATKRVRVDAQGNVIGN